MTTTDTRKTALVTGCSPGGIGHALALEFAQRGLRVFATARSASALDALAAAHVNIEPLALEVTDPAAIAALADTLAARTGGTLDYLVNNAGAQYMTTALDADVDRVEALYQVNLFSVMRIVKALAPLLIAAKGKIVQIGSVTRDVPVFWQGPYNASKAALSQWSHTLRLELAPFDVQVVEVVTGFVQSNIMRDGIQAPPDTRYEAIRASMEDFKVNGNRRGTPAAEYARRVARQVLRPRAPMELWEGRLATVLRYLMWLPPRWFSNMIMWRIFKLDVLVAAVKKSKKA